jgi:hypothetical protein
MARKSQPVERRNDVDIALIKQDIGYIKASVEGINHQLDIGNVKFVSKEQFDGTIARLKDELRLLRMLVFGAAGIILIAVMTAIVKFAINGSGGQ